MRGQRSFVRGAILRGVAVAAVIALGSTCARQDGSDPGPPRSDRAGGTLVVDAPHLSQLNSFDPVRVTDINRSSIAGALYEGLLGYPPGSLEGFAPVLARSWEVSEDGRVWTFRLRPEVRFHDDPCFADGRGRQVTPSDVRYSLLRSLRERSEAAPLSLRELIRGAREFADGTMEEVPGIEVVDTDGIRFTLSEPSNAFPHALATSAGWIVPREAVERYGSNFGRRPVGTGPFRLASWNTARLVLVRNDHYWKTDEEGAQLPYLDSIVMGVALATDGRLVLPDLLQSDLHILLFTGELGLEELGRLSEFMENHGIRAIHTAKLNTIFYGWDMARDNVWTRSRDLRHAVSRAVRRPDPSELLVPASGLLPPGLPDCDPQLDPVTREPESARRSLQQAGYRDGKGLPPLQVSAMGRSPYLLDGVIGSLEEVGFDPVLHTAPWDRHWEAVENGDYEFFRDGWIADYPDAENFFQLFYSTSPVNHTHYSSTSYDRLFERFQELAPGSPERANVCHELEQILRRDAPAIFLYHEKALYLVRPEVRNFEYSVNPLERKFYEYVWLDPEAGP